MILNRSTTRQVRSNVCREGQKRQTYSTLWDVRRGWPGLSEIGLTTQVFGTGILRKACARAHIHTHTQANIHTQSHTHIYTQTQANIHTHTHTNTHTYCRGQNIGTLQTAFEGNCSWEQTHTHMKAIVAESTHTHTWRCTIYTICVAEPAHTYTNFRSVHTHTHTAAHSKEHIKAALASATNEPSM